MSFLSDVLGVFKYRKEKQKLELEIQQLAAHVRAILSLKEKLEFEIEQLKAEAKERESLIQKPTLKEIARYSELGKIRSKLERDKFAFHMGEPDEGRIRRVIKILRRHGLRRWLMIGAVTLLVFILIRFIFF